MEANPHHTSRRVAAIDIGSNTIKLLVACNDGGLQTVHQAVEECRIATGIAKAHPVLTEESMQRGTAAVIRLVEQARTHGAERMRIVATSAVRDAPNGADFAHRISAACGCPVDILSGDNEAQTIALALRHDPCLRGLQAYTHFDLGGGSLEFNRIEAGNLSVSTSMPLGAVRLTEELVAQPTHGFTSADAHRIRDRVQGTLRNFGIEPNPTPLPMVYTGGSVALARALIHHRPLGSPDLGIHLLQRVDLANLLDRLAPCSFEERIRLHPLPSNRADVVCAALQILLATLDYFGNAALMHSTFALRHGISVNLLELA